MSAQHVFERAGLGRAPFRFIGCVRKVGPIDLGNGMFVGAPGQPMGACKYCGQGIAECCLIEDADGKTFEVGNVCVRKTGDAGLRKAVEAHARRARAASADARILRALDALAEPEVKAALAARPHPQPWGAAKGLTLADWADWMFRNAGRTGRVKVARAIEAIARGEA